MVRGFFPPTHARSYIYREQNLVPGSCHVHVWKDCHRICGKMVPLFVDANKSSMLDHYGNQKSCVRTASLHLPLFHHLWYNPMQSYASLRAKLDTMCDTSQVWV